MPDLTPLPEGSETLTPKAEGTGILAALSEGTQTLAALAEQFFTQTIEGGMWPSAATFPSADATFPSTRSTITTPGPVLETEAESDLTLTTMAES